MKAFFKVSAHARLSLSLCWREGALDGLDFAVVVSSCQLSVLGLTLPP